MPYLIFGVDLNPDVLGQLQGRLQLQLPVHRFRRCELLEREIGFLVQTEYRSDDIGLGDVTTLCDAAWRGDAARQVRRVELYLELVDRLGRVFVNVLWVEDDKLVGRLPTVTNTIKLFTSTDTDIDQLLLDFVV